MKYNVEYIGYESPFHVYKVNGVEIKSTHKHGKDIVIAMYERQINPIKGFLKWNELELEKPVKVYLNGIYGTVTLHEHAEYITQCCEICFVNNDHKFSIFMNKDEEAIFNALHLETV